MKEDNRREGGRVVSSALESFIPLPSFAKTYLVIVYPLIRAIPFGLRPNSVLIDELIRLLDAPASNSNDLVSEVVNSSTLWIDQEVEAERFGDGWNSGKAR